MTATKRVRDPEGTRQRLVQSAFDEIYAHGYAGASLDRILAESGVTKGALYHHFGSKAALAHAVIDEVIHEWVVGNWLTPLEAYDDPLQGLQEIVTQLVASPPDHVMEYGCPLNNLNSELSSTDDEFRVHLNQLYDDWRGGIAGALERGQERGFVRKDVNVASTSAFLVSVIQGMATTAKSSHDRDLSGQVASEFLTFIESLREA